MTRITIKDIAKALNVSTSTVSKALSDSYEISDKTKRMIVTYAKKMGYIPSKTAQNLRMGKSNTIGVIVSDVSNTFFSQVLQSIQLSLEVKGIYTIIMQSGFDEDTERGCIQSMMNKEVDGLLISPVKSDSNIDLLQKFQKSHPIIFFDRIKSSLKAPKIGIDNENAGYKATKHLLRKAYKNIVIILGKGLGISQSRLNGYKKALKEYRRPATERDIAYITLGNLQLMDQEIAQFITNKINESPKIDALVCGTENISTRTIGVIQKMGIKIPEEIAIVGFANTPLASFFNPGLTTIVQPTERLGQISVEKILKLLKQSPPYTKDSEQIILDTELIVRESSQKNHLVK